MNRPEAESAIDWTIENLELCEPISDNLKEIWTEKAEEYTKSEWLKGVKSHIKTRKTNFKPELGSLCLDMVKEDTAAKMSNRGMPYPEGWFEDPKKSFNENYKDMLAARDAEKSKDKL